MVPFYDITSVAVIAGYIWGRGVHLGVKILRGTYRSFTEPLDRSGNVKKFLTYLKLIY